MSYADRARITL